MWTNVTYRARTVGRSRILYPPKRSCNGPSLTVTDRYVTQADLVIPLTHQSVARDRELAAEGLFPLILGGHDHDPYIETINNSTFIKVGKPVKQSGRVYLYVRFYLFFCFGRHVLALHFHS